MAAERAATIQMVSVGGSVVHSVSLFKVAVTLEDFDNCYDAGDINKYSIQSHVYVHSTDGMM